MAVEIRLACERLQHEAVSAEEPPNLMTPGDVVTTDTGFMRGHGTYMSGDKLYASVAGVVERYNKLICVQPLQTRYNGEVGDVVVGRILEVGQKRWRVNTRSKLNSVLMLSSVNLPGGELRRRSEEDERLMRDYLSEGDLISAEVQAVFSDGVMSLHTRSLKYGKLCQGVLVQVSPSLVPRRKTHFHSLPCGASLIIGNNGYIWVCPSLGDDSDNTGGFVQDLEPVSRGDREVIARLHNCILALASARLMIFDTSVLYAYENSLRYQVKDINKPETAREISELTRQRLEQES